MNSDKEQELIDLLMMSSEKAIDFGYVCRVRVFNDVPVQYKVSIIGIGTDFDYTDGTTYRDVDDPINVGTGGIAHTESNDSTKCVKTAFIAIKVLQQGFPPSALVARRDNTPGTCLVEIPLHLTIHSQITESQLKGNIKDILELNFQTGS